MNNSVLCSVIIPSYNRQALLEMVLKGLERQTIAQSLFEVIVVLDGGKDDSNLMLTTWQQSKRIANLEWHWQVNSGQAAARNKGVALAKAPVVLFLDDDVVPEPDLLEVHLAWHSQNLPIAVLGDCLIVKEKHESQYLIDVWAWWEDKYHQRSLAGHYPNWRDFCAGNVSLRRQDFLEVGGFDTRFKGYGGEDYELGYRLQQAKVQFIADRQAKARHYHRTTVTAMLRAKRQEAHGDVLLGRKHPELRSSLDLAREVHGKYKLLVKLAFKAPAFGDFLMNSLLPKLLSFYERLKFRKKWQKLIGIMQVYFYWRGLRDEFKTTGKVANFVKAAPQLPELIIDITNGIPEDLASIPVNSPSKLKVTFQGKYVTTCYLPGGIEAPLHNYLAEVLASSLKNKIRKVFW
jgi:glycosyltransferase involved in cell wall biosynthesis